jgi:uncharacterized protein (DUF2126 family)/transglutaminase-like putative cysteine protease
LRLLVQHRSQYVYPRSAALGPHVLRLRPANHTRARVETYRLAIEQEHRLHWQQDPHGNHLARITFRAGQRVERLDVLIELAVDIKPINPFDFFVDDRVKHAPFHYPEPLDRELAPFLDTTDPAYAGGPRTEAFLATLPTTGDTVGLVVECGRLVAHNTRYVIREEHGVWTPEETLRQGRGSCRDSAVLLIAALRSRGIAARFVSGYLIQLTDEGMLPDEPRGVSRDVVDLHAWAEVYLPGAGWIGLDATSGLLCGEGHIPLACTATPATAAPIDGTSDVVATSVEFSTAIARLGHEARPTAPYPDEVWDRLLTSADAADAALTAAGVTLTIGGEPTFNSREEPEAEEWNGAALGPSKWRKGLSLASELRARLAPGAAILHRMGKHYPGESLPRWALDLIARRDGAPLWTADRFTTDATIARSDAEDRAYAGPDSATARTLATAIASRLGVQPALHAAYEDPWRLVQDEASLPVGVDPATAGLDDDEARRRLARVLDRGTGTVVGWVLPLARAAGAGWLTERWQLRREQLFLVPGDSPMGLRLPLRTLGPGLPVPWPVEEPTERDPRRADLADEDDADVDAHMAADSSERALDELESRRRSTVAAARRTQGARVAAIAPATVTDAAWSTPVDLPQIGIRTALCVEPRDGALWVFLPPVASADDFQVMLAAIDGARAELAAAGRPVDVLLEGYGPPSSPSLLRFAVTPDPGVLEVNLPPVASGRDYAALIDTVFDAALHCGLHSEKYLLDGRLSGSGGGNHITVGGPTPLSSPMLARPAILASLITFLQHHPSLSYLFTGLFVGPTSQAPRVDEARHDALYELEIALARAHAEPTAAPWLVDALFRNLMVDVAGSTHRAELCIDKLFDPQTPYGRQGLAELRAFEMPPHPRLATAQGLLVRSLIAGFARQPYSGPLVRWGQRLHDQFLLPYWMWHDLEDVLGFLAERGVALPAEAYRPFVELRCPLAGTLDAGTVSLEVRNAIEPWHVLGEEVAAGGTSRYVDSSMERVEVRVHGLVPERHVVTVNGYVLPLRPTGEAQLAVGGVRFRAWAPPHSLHPHLGIHHPLRFEIVDTWGRRSLGACAYHVWHPEGRAYLSPPLTRFEASARRAQRFTREGPTPAPVRPMPVTPHPDAPCTLDLRRLGIDRPMPRAEDWADDRSAAAPRAIPNGEVA